MKVLHVIKGIKTVYILTKSKLMSKGNIGIKGRVSCDNGVKFDSRINSFIELDGKISIKRNCEFRAFNGGNLIIHSGCSFNNNCFIASASKIEIQEGTIFAPNVVVVDHDHDYKDPNGLKALSYKTGNIYIGKNVWIGANVVILRNTIIGDNCVIGAGSIVSGTVEENTVLVQKREQEYRKFQRI